jgi:[acyl-carrier-protein] S-malonyltransferase
LYLNKKIKNNYKQEDLMADIAFVFPGQGAQYVGMGKALYENFDIAKDLFNKADEQLGYSLHKICFEGPEEELKKTGNTQPGIFVVSAIIQTLLREGGLVPGATAGHSLGEYSALFCSGALSFESTLNLVIERGRAMNAASEATDGTMAAIIGLDSASLEKICAEASEKGIVRIANINSPAQIVITGEKEAVKAASEKASEAGAKRVLPLAVHGAFHSPLMNSAAERLREVLKDVEIKKPEIPFINNADAEFIEDPEAIRDSLARQVCSCVRWVESVEKLVASGVSSMVEAGPGKVLMGLGRRISKATKVHPCDTPEGIEKVLALFK